jgi:hypothetical protein
MVADPAIGAVPGISRVVYPFTAEKLVALEVLDGSFMFFCRRAGLECPQVFPLACLRVRVA